MRADGDAMLEHVRELATTLAASQSECRALAAERERMVSLLRESESLRAEAKEELARREADFHVELGLLTERHEAMRATADAAIDEARAEALRSARLEEESGDDANELTNLALELQAATASADDVRERNEELG